MLATLNFNGTPAPVAHTMTLHAQRRLPFCDLPFSSLQGHEATRCMLPLVTAHQGGQGSDLTTGFGKPPRRSKKELLFSDPCFPPMCQEQRSPSWWCLGLSRRWDFGSKTARHIGMARAWHFSETCCTVFDVLRTAGPLLKW